LRVYKKEFERGGKDRDGSLRRGIVESRKGEKGGEA